MQQQNQQYKPSPALMPQTTVLENFQSMTGGYMPQQAGPHRFIQNFVPEYFRIVGTADDANVYKKTNPAYPLVLSREVSNNVSLVSDLTCIVPSQSLGNYVGISETGYVYAIDPTGGIGYLPGGPFTGNVGADVAFYSNKIFGSHFSSASGVYYSNVSLSPVWNGLTGLSTAKHYMEPFGLSLYVTDTSAGYTSDLRLVKIVNTAFTVGAGLDLGPGWFVEGMVGIESTYLAVIAYYSADASTTFAAADYLFLWNGTSQNNPDYARKINGKFHSAIVKPVASETPGYIKESANLFVFAQQGPDIVCFEMHNTILHEVGRISNLTLRWDYANIKGRVAVVGNYFLLPTTSGMLMWDPMINKESSIVYYDPNTPVSLLGALYAGSAGSIKYYFQKLSTSTVYTWSPFAATRVGSAEYDSNYQFIPLVDPQTGQQIPNSQGRGQIDYIEVLYTAAPPSLSDNIKITLTYKDQYVSDAYSTYVGTISNTSANSSTTPSGGQVLPDTSRAIIRNIGAKCSEFSIQAFVTCATTSWDLAIKKIIVHWTPATQPI